MAIDPLPFSDRITHLHVPAPVERNSRDGQRLVALVGIAAMWVYLLGYWIAVLDASTNTFKQFVGLATDRRFLVLGPALVVIVALCSMSLTEKLDGEDTRKASVALMASMLMAAVIAVGAVIGGLISLTDIGDTFGGAVDGFTMSIAAAAIAAAAGI